MVIYLKHPIHGRKIATLEAEAKYDESKGWERYEIAALLKPPVASNALVQEVTIEVLREKYLEKFGKKPHHKKSADTLRAELAA